MSASWITRPELQAAIDNERAYNLRLARRLDDNAQMRELWYGDDDEIAKGLRKAADNFKQRALGNPTPETEMHS
jgi:hypothetical protein